ncbi:hypothetical protein [Novosphingobium sp. 9]|uniref:hypothetical protein n=1 Tax=Novosphingobium sp. 9 TaxID=2025349 RepID=UPI0021B52583|nr:hypothetical protein [Novosphingobium sp. 9]
MGRAFSARRWLAELDDLALAASQASPESEEACLRAMVALLRACPEGYRVLELEGERADVLARRLAAGAPESAAMTLLPVHAGIMTSRGGTARISPRSCSMTRWANPPLSAARSRWRWSARWRCRSSMWRSR